MPRVEIEDNEGGITMTTASILFMILVLGVYGGGFAYFIMKAMNQQAK